MGFYNLIAFDLKSDNISLFLLILALIFLAAALILAVVVFDVKKINKNIKNENEELKEEVAKGKEELNNSFEAKLKAESLSEAKSNFLLSVAMELRTPLSTILGIDELLIKDNFNKEVLENLNNIYSSGKIMESLLNDLVDLKKIETGMYFTEEDAYSVEDLIRETYRLAKTDTRFKNISFEYDFSPSLPSVLIGDASRLRQIVMNLISHSIQSTPMGKIILSIWEEKNEEDDGVRLNCAIKDTGIGLKEDELLELRKGFLVAEDPTFYLANGTNMGLLVTNLILKQMGSALQIESEYGQGTIYQFSIVQKVEDERTIGNVDEILEKINMPKERANEVFLAPKVSILAVDDNNMNLAVINGILKPTKMQVDLADSGKAAVEACRNNKYDLILLDHMMPEMDGIETLRKIKRLKVNNYKNVPIIVVTASAATGVKDFYLRHGFSDYISKPIEVVELYRVIKKYLPKELLVNEDSYETKIASEVIDIQNDMAKESEQEANE